MNLHHYLVKSGFSKNESTIILSSYKLGPQPASIIAKQTSLNRTTVYKILERLKKRAIISESQKGGTAYFFVPNKEVIRKHLSNKMSVLEELHERLPLLESELDQLDKNKKSRMPLINVYDGIIGIKNLYDDVKTTAEDSGLLTIKLFASNTMDDQLNAYKQVKDYHSEVFDELKNANIKIDTYIGNGLITLEHLDHLDQGQSLEDLPAGNDTIHIFLVGDTIFQIIFGEIPYGIKIKSKQFAQTLHYLFENSR